jgi:glycosyltransferase involved in cell wall biosynthesis
MRVLMTADPVGGVWSYSLELAAALAPHGIELALATMGAPLTPAQRAELSGLGNVELFESGYRLEWMDDPWADLDLAGEWLLGVSQRVAPDLIHLNGYLHAALPWGVPVLVVGHSCVLSWWRAVKGTPAPPAWDRYRAGVARGLGAADLVVAPTAALLAALREEYGPLAGARVVPNARNPARFVAQPKEPLILGAGRIWDEAKNLAALAAVAPGLPWPVYLAGEARPPGGGAALPDAGKGSASAAVRYLGQLTGAEMAGWLGRASLYALPARYEPFGLSALEAGLSGCALVLGDIPSLREVWGDAARFVPPDDRAALRSTLEELIEKEGARMALAERSHARALEYRPERLGTEYRAAYAEARGRWNMARGRPVAGGGVSAPAGAACAS